MEKDHTHNNNRTFCGRIKMSDVRQNKHYDGESTALVFADTCTPYGGTICFVENADPITDEEFNQIDQGTSRIVRL